MSCTACLVVNVSHVKLLAVKAGTSSRLLHLPDPAAWLACARYMRPCFVDVQFCFS